MATLYTLTNTKTLEEGDSDIITKAEAQARNSVLFAQGSDWRWWQDIPADDFETEGE